MGEGGREMARYDAMATAKVNAELPRAMMVTEYCVVERSWIARTKGSVISVRESGLSGVY